MINQEKNKARQEAGQKLQSDCNFTATDAERRLVAAMLCRPDRYFRQALARMPDCRRYEPCDHYFALAARCNDWYGPTSIVTDTVFDFAWYLNDRATDIRERDRYRQHRKCPPYGAAIARQRARGLVPVPVGGYHATIALAPQFRIAAPSLDTCMLVYPNGESETYDYRFLAGLRILILTTGMMYKQAGWIARTLAADGVESVHVRQLNHPKHPDEQFFPEKGLSWGL